MAWPTHDTDPCRAHPSLIQAAGLLPDQSSPQCHEITYAHIIAEELGLPAALVQMEEGDTDTALYGFGTYARRSTPTAGTAGAMDARKIGDDAAKIAVHLLDVGEDERDWEPAQFSVKGAVAKSVTIWDCAFAAYTNLPEGPEQIHRGPTQGRGQTLFEEIPSDEDGNPLAGSFMDHPGAKHPW